MIVIVHLCHPGLQGVRSQRRGRTNEKCAVWSKQECACKVTNKEGPRAAVFVEETHAVKEDQEMCPESSTPPTDESIL